MERGCVEVLRTKSVVKRTSECQYPAVDVLGYGEIGEQNCYACFLVRFYAWTRSVWRKVLER